MNRLGRSLGKLLSRNNKNIQNIGQKTIYSLNYVQKFNFSQDKYSQETMDNLKRQAEQFYESEVKEKKSDVVNIENVEQWKSEVMESKLPVILDCYADWCEPCKKLDPLLTQKAESLEGKCKLVKLNIDNNPEIATALKVKSIPTVFLINGQNALDGFVGFPDETVLENFFQSVNRVCGLADEESDITSALAMAQTFIEENKNLEDSETVLKDVLGHSKWKNRFGGKCHALMGLLCCLKGDTPSYEKQISELKQHFSEEMETQEIQDILKLCEQRLAENQENSQNHPFIKECEDLLAQNADDFETRYQLAEYQSNNSLYEECIDNCLYIIKKNRNWEDKKAQGLLLSLFESLGSSSELTIKGRQKLQRLLF